MTAHSLAHQGAMERLAKSFPSLFHHRLPERLGQEQMVTVPARQGLLDPRKFLRNKIEGHELAIYDFNEENCPFSTPVADISERLYGVLTIQAEEGLNGLEVALSFPDFLSNPSRFEDVAWFLDQLIRDKDWPPAPESDCSLVFFSRGDDNRIYTVICTLDEEPFSPSWLLFVGPFSRSNHWAQGSRLVHPIRALA